MKAPIPKGEQIVQPTRTELEAAQTQVERF
jgi:hypothetical protein